MTNHYRSNLRDIEFNLFEVLRVQDRLGHGRFDDIDEDTAREILREVEQLASGPIAASYVSSDRTPPTYDPATFSVSMPDSFRASYDAYMDAEWWRLDLPRELGGTESPRSLWWSCIEMVQGAHAPVYMFGSGPGFAGLIHRMGTDDQKRFAEIMLEGLWGATMVLTEPEAGSDVGAGRTRAIPQPDGTWHIEGVKRFITSAEHDLADNIVHLVLARPVGVDGAGSVGTKGLSLFVVPKYHVDLDTKQLGERNGVMATNVEHKMGLKISTTCELTFGAHGTPAVGWLLGDTHDGIAQMFHVIESARMQVGVKAIAAMSTGYLNARDYARQRVQGGDLTQRRDRSAPRVTIDRHPDVRRTLLLQKAYSEGMRAVYQYAADWLDRDLPASESVNDLLLPIVKGVGSERSWEMLTHALQTFGGSGYLQDFPMEQYLRDNKIDTLYEGTTAIQGSDFFFRKIARDRRASLDVVLGEMQAFLGSAEAASVPEIAPALATAIADVSAMVDTMIEWEAASADEPTLIYRVGLNSTRLLMSVGDLLIGWMLARGAAVATAALESASADEGFYRGKVAVARFFAATVLPEISARRGVLDATDDLVMQVADDAF